MRRLLSICLFAAVLLPSLAPLLSMGAAAETTLPACCRRDGKHHCMGNMAVAAAADGQTRVQAPREICPYQQRALVVAHQQLSVAAVPVETAAIRLRQPSTPAQAECLRRISFDRSRQKRGPPTLLS
jgi:hypothetical protein